MEYSYNEVSPLWKTLENTFLDLGFAPPSNAYLTADELKRPKKYYPLKIESAATAGWYKLRTTEADELFNADYAYFSMSTSWLAHAKLTAVHDLKLGLNDASNVIEIASNDGYLLKNFVAAGIPCFGIEPAESTATNAELGIQ